MISPDPEISDWSGAGKDVETAALDDPSCRPPVRREGVATHPNYFPA
jgi:hypothetical protein